MCCLPHSCSDQHAGYISIGPSVVPTPNLHLPKESDGSAAGESRRGAGALRGGSAYCCGPAEVLLGEALGSVVFSVTTDANVGRRHTGGHFSWDHIYWAGHSTCLTMENDNFRQYRQCLSRPEIARCLRVSTSRRRGCHDDDARIQQAWELAGSSLTTTTTEIASERETLQGTWAFTSTQSGSNWPSHMAAASWTTTNTETTSEQQPNPPDIGATSTRLTWGRPLHGFIYDRARLGFMCD